MALLAAATSRRIAAAMKRRTLVLAILLAPLPAYVPAQERGVEVFATIALQGALTEIEPLLRSVGAPVRIEYGTTAALVERIADGATADLAILTEDALLTLADSGHVRPPVGLVRSRIGVAVADDATPPVLRTTEDFVAFLRATPSIAYTMRGVSGVHMAKLIEELGLVEAVRSKALIVDGFAGAPLREGRVVAAVQQISELRFSGAKNIVPLPEALQVETVFAVAIASATALTSQTTEVVRLLTSREAARAYESSGLSPAFR
jgi:molybdate transport system substrate-binding protein